MRTEKQSPEEIQEEFFLLQEGEELTPDRRWKCAHCPTELSWLDQSVCGFCRYRLCSKCTPSNCPV